MLVIEACQTAVIVGSETRHDHFNEGVDVKTPPWPFFYFAICHHHFA